MRSVIGQSWKDGKEIEYVVYVLRCADGTLYTGYTADLSRRLALHEQGKGAKYTRGRGPFEVMYTRTYPEKTVAMREEARIKRLRRKEKLKLIEEKQTE